MGSSCCQDWYPLPSPQLSLVRVLSCSSHEHPLPFLCHPVTLVCLSVLQLPPHPLPASSRFLFVLIELPHFSALPQPGNANRTASAARPGQRCPSLAALQGGSWTDAAGAITTFLWSPCPLRLDGTAWEIRTFCMAGISLERCLAHPGHRTHPGFPIWGVFAPLMGEQRQRGGGEGQFKSAADNKKFSMAREAAA